jgi:hypothetical protein
MRLVPLIVLVGAIGCAPAQTPGTFNATGSMITARYFHTATLLPNGMVLVAGGVPVTWPDAPVLASAELYDPATGIFTATGSMTTGRAQHSATLLADGRVLIAGGTGDRSTETYDPSVGAFTSTGDTISQPYPAASATLLQDGRVFIATYPTAQIYDPLSSAFSATAAYAGPAPAFLGSSTLLADGRILLTGGINICFEALCADPGSGWAELYDPAANTFTLAGDMQWWNNRYIAILLANGKVLFVGNRTNDGAPAPAQLFDPGDRTFGAIGNASASHFDGGAATLLPDATVLITGGMLPDGRGQTVADRYAPESGAFTSTGSTITDRMYHTSTLLPDGTVLAAGGYIQGPSATSCAELYRPVALTPTPRLFPGAIWNAATGQIASSQSPAVAGDVLSIYTTSLVEDGVIAPQVAIGGRLAQTLFFGDAPGYPGYFQVNFRMPTGVAPGPAVSVRLTYIGRPSNAVTIGVQ